MLPAPMDTSVDPMSAMRKLFISMHGHRPDPSLLVETKTSEWPQDLEDIDKLIKLAEGRVDDLSIDIAAAESEP